jgi:lipopolysaccharide exporter
MASGATWSVLLRVTDRSIGLISTVVLARLLVPADFGLVTLASSFVALLGLVTAFGLDFALIQKADVERGHFDTVWTLNVISGVAIALALVALANPVAKFYEDVRLVNVIVGLALAQAISGFQNVGIIALRRDMAFDREFRFGLYRKLATTFVVTLPLAFALRDYWALVGGMIAGSCIGVALSYQLHPYRPRPTLVAMRDLLRFSGWLQLTSVVSFVSRRSADFIIGRVAGMSALGSFSVGREIAGMVSSEVAAPVHRGVFPSYAKIAGDRRELKDAYLKVLSVLVLVIVPSAIGLALLAEPVVLVFFGEKWRDAVPVIRLLAINGMLYLSVNTGIYVYLALGITHHTTSITIVHAAVSITLMLLLVPQWGIQGAAYALLGATLMAMPLTFALISKVLRVTFTDLAAVLWRPLSAGLLMAGALVVARQHWGPAMLLLEHALDMVASAALGAAVYAAITLLLWRRAGRPEGAETLVLEQLKKAAMVSMRRLKARSNAS